MGKENAEYSLYYKCINKVHNDFKRYLKQVFGTQRRKSNVDKEMNRHAPNLEKCCFTTGLVWFYGTSTIVGYLMLNPFYTYKQFYFKQFSLA